MYGPAIEQLEGTPADKQKLEDDFMDLLDGSLDDEDWTMYAIVNGTDALRGYVVSPGDLDPE